MNAVRVVLELTRARLLQMVREPEVLFWVFAFPIMLTMVLGLAFRGGGPSDSKIAVVAGPGAEETLAALVRDEQIEAQVLEREEAQRRLRTGAVDLVVETASGTVLRFDEARDEAVTARLRAEAALQAAAGRTDPLALGHERLTERGSRYIDWLVPGLLGLNLMSTGIWGVGFALADSRQKKLIKRFLVTPMARSSFLLSFVLARLVLLVAEVVVLILFACLVLGVPFRGPLGSFAALCLFGGLAFSGLGVLIGSRARTSEGASGLINLSMMPMGLASGVFFSYERFSEGLQPWIRALPLTALNDALRGVMLEGRSLAAFLPELGVMAAWGLGAFWLGLAIFRWK